MKQFLYSLIILHLFSCSDKNDAENITSEASISDIEIQELLNATDIPEEERSSLEEQMINLREDCANGDDDACEELRALIEELETYREEDERIDDEREDREENEIESNECAEVSRVAYEDCLNDEGSEEDCREEAALAYEDCLDR
jgi:hypothetical protein